MPEQPSLNRDVEFIYEMGCIRFIQRTWRQFLNPDFANLAEHTLRVAWISLVIAKHEGGADLEKVMKMALMHDIYESRTGDVNYLARVYTERDKAGGFREVFQGTILEDDFMDIFSEYDQRSSLEAQIVKDADNLDIDTELNEQAAAGHVGIRKSKEEMRQHVGATKLYTATGQRLFHELRAADPHAWHRNANNRFTAGDWSAQPATDTNIETGQTGQANTGYHLNYGA